MYLDKKRKVWMVSVDRVINGVRHRKTKRLPAGTKEREALAIEQRMQTDLLHALKTTRNTEWEDYVCSLLADKSWIDQAISKCVYRANLRKQRCTIDREHIAKVMLISNGRCQITGVKFCNEVVPGQSYRPYMHSIDRINSKEGYTASNIRIVCAGVNMAMMHWGEEMFSQFAVGYVLHKYGFMASIGNDGKTE